MRELVTYPESMGQFAHWLMIASKTPQRVGESGFGQSRVASSPIFPRAWFRSCAARPGRSGQAFAFSVLPTNPRSVAGYKGVNQPGLPYGMRATNSAPDAATGRDNFPHKGIRAKDGCRADKLSLGQVVIPPIWTRTQTSSPTYFRGHEAYHGSTRERGWGPPGPATNRSPAMITYICRVSGSPPTLRFAKHANAKLLKAGHTTIKTPALDTEAFVAFDGARRIGLLTFFRDEKNAYFVEIAYVDPRRRGKGIFGGLMAALKRHAAKNKVAGIFLEVSAKNTVMQAVMAKCGKPSYVVFEAT